EWFIVDATARALRSPAAGRRIGETERFMPAEWSADGSRIAGQVRAQSGAVSGIAVYSLATNTFASVPGVLAHANGWLWPSWLADGRRLVVRRPDGIALVDA